MNRLKLDWSLNMALERKSFVDKYINTINNPTEEELETIANYILWGKDSDGKSAVERGELEIETKNKTWQKKEIDSLDEMMESPTFNEASLRNSSVPPTRIKRENFSREDALKKCPEAMRQVFLDLFAQIDELDLCINLYDFAHGKRKNPPRAELIEKFSKEQQEKFKERITHWNQYTYLKRRHLLVELRRQQFTLRDSFSNSIIRETPPEPIEPEILPDFDIEIPVFPLGVFNDKLLSFLIFREKDRLNPTAYSEAELKKISDYLWIKNSEARPQRFFDFCELEHVYQLFQQLFELEDSDINDNTNFLIRTLKYYLDFAELTEVQKEILDLKIKKVKNQDIADVVNKKFGKSYTANYISTIFRQKIIPKINEAAAFHKKILSNLFFEEEFKKCTCCGTWLLRGPEIFVRKARSKDGLANRCKKCDKAERQRKKEARLEV